MHSALEAESLDPRRPPTGDRVRDPQAWRGDCDELRKTRLQTAALDQSRYMDCRRARGRVLHRRGDRIRKHYHQAGITSLVIDYRNDEGASDDPSGLYRFGRTEWEDVESAVRYALGHGAEEIVLHGYSTGAALHLAFFENSDLASQVIAAVYDSPNADTGAALRLEASRRTIPGTSIPVPSSLISVAMFVADLRWDVGWEEIDYIDRAAEIISTPTLIFHGRETTVCRSTQPVVYATRSQIWSVSSRLKKQGT